MVPETATQDGGQESPNPVSTFVGTTWFPAAPGGHPTSDEPNPITVQELPDWWANPYPPCTVFSYPGAGPMWNSTYEGSTLETDNPVVTKVPAFGPFVASYAVMAAVAPLGTEDPVADEVVVVVAVVQTFEPAAAADDSFAFVFDP